MGGKKSFDFSAIPRTAVKVILSPAAFFREMPKTGGYGEPLLFMIAMGVVTGILTDILGLLKLATIFSTGMAIAAIIVIPVVYGVLGFIGAAIAFVIWKFMGSLEPYETAYRCVAYIAAFMPVVTVIDAVPYAGWLAVVALVTYVYVSASIETHKIPVPRAWTVYGIIGAVLLISGYIRH